MNQKNTPLYSAIQKHIEKRSFSFHVPGHKNGRVGWEGSHFKQFLPFDVTEISGLDDLHAPQEAIKDGEDLLRKFYGAKTSCFLVGGSTVGNLAMILASCGAGDTVLVQRNCHKSIINGLKLAKALPVFLQPEWDEKTMSPGGVSRATLKKALAYHPEAKACIFTYPTYYGTCYPLEELIVEAHLNDVPVLVDEAHGPHLQLEQVSFSSALQAGADIVVQSAHKILPAMTMGSYLHINSNRISERELRKYLSILQSSSPSYPIMASLDMARFFIANYDSEDWRYMLKERNQFIHEVRTVEDATVLECDDPIKLLLRVKGVSGFDLSYALEKINIFPELADHHQVLLILPLFKKGSESYLNDASKRMISALCSLEKKKEVDFSFSITEEEKIQSLVIPYSESKEKKQKLVKVKQAVGMVSSEMVIPYPPGVPLLMEGERISEGKVEQLQMLKLMGARFQGNHVLEQEMIYVYD
ncbi:aminotransferase class I/II-fold pyridoxal phosphate-dependent enzyme [Bacillus sp. 2205SS5-2]|uniref:aminotransferase class I/II-fold pyridoxal phosphate-dependent enzyme n=1 Tax=Bacillus sp. 2205SS5-2 TaxID=3109031 RepID=UPI0030070797